MHFLQVGCKRRAIILPFLAYNDIALGPVPREPWARRRFSNHLVEGNSSVVFDIKLLALRPNPMDYGCYQDLLLIEEAEIAEAKESAADYVEECSKAGIEPPAFYTPHSHTMLGEECEFPYSPFVSPGLPHPNQS